MVRIPILTDGPGGYRIEISNILGQRVEMRTQTGSQGAFEAMLDVSNYAPGVYLIRVVHGNKVENGSLIVSN